MQLNNNQGKGIPSEGRSWTVAPRMGGLRGMEEGPGNLAVRLEIYHEAATNSRVRNPSPNLQRDSLLVLRSFRHPFSTQQLLFVIVGESSVRSTHVFFFTEMHALVKLTRLRAEKNPGRPTSTTF